VCRTDTPPLRELAPGHQVACHFPENQLEDTLAALTAASPEPI
jgi:hypothetical protein